MNILVVCFRRKLVISLKHGKNSFSDSIVLFYSFDEFRHMRHRKHTKNIRSHHLEISLEALRLLLQSSLFVLIYYGPTNHRHVSRGRNIFLKVLPYNLQRARILYLYKIGVVSEHLVEENDCVHVPIASLAVTGLLGKLPSRALFCAKVSVEAILGEQVFSVVLVENKLWMMGVSVHYELVCAVQVVCTAHTAIDEGLVQQFVQGQELLLMLDRHGVCLKLERPLVSILPIESLLPRVLPKVILFFLPG